MVSSAPGLSPGPYRILLVDDDANSLAALRLALADDFEVEAHRSAETALEALVTRRFHVVCSDFRMPELDGAAFLARVLARPLAPSCVLISGTPLQALAALVNPAQAVAVVSKPFAPERLIRLIAQLANIAEVRWAASERRGAIPTPPGSS